MRRLPAVLAVSAVLAVLTELSSGFQPGFRYVFQAHWSVYAGIPQIASKEIHSTIGADLIVAIDQDYERIDFLLENVTLNKTIITSHDFKEIPNSFSFRIDPKHGIYINENSSDNNFYLGIASQIMPFLPNLTFWDDGQHNVSPLEESASPITYRHESNILGTLPVVYTKRALTASEAYFHCHNSAVEGDHVGDWSLSSHDCPNPDDDIYLVKRFVKADCNSLSYHQGMLNKERSHTGGNFDDNNCGSGFSQYYENSYIVRKSSGSLRVEKIVTTGKLEVSPAMRDGSEHFVSQSQSIFRLVLAKPFKKNLAETEDLEKLYTSPVATALVGDTPSQNLDGLEPGILSKPFDVRRTGRLEIETAIKINLYTDALTSRNLHEINRLAHYPREIKNQLSLLGIDLQRVKRNLTYSEGGRRSLFHDILATTGTEAAVHELLNNKDEWSDRPIFIDTSMMIHLRSPNALPKLKEYVLEESDIDESPFVVSQRIINFAMVLGRLCMTDVQNNDVLDDPCIIRQQFIASISQKLEATDVFWKQMVYVKALVNLKHARLSEVLMPYVMNEKPVDVAVRLVALDSLASWNNADTRKVVPLLFFLLENPMEKREVKARALGILSSHPKSDEDWNRLAMFTHRPGSTDLAAVVYYSIKAVSELQIPSQASSALLARKALLLAKPATAAERYSSFYTWVKYCFRNQRTTMDYVAWIKNPASPLPHNLAMVLRSETMGGLSVQSKMETVITNGDDHGDLDSLAITMFLNKIHSQRVKISEYDDWSNYSNDTDHPTEEERGETLTRGLFSWLASIGAQIFVPLEQEFIQDIFKNFISLYGMDMNWHRFLDPMGSHYIQSFNEMGLPLRLQSCHPTSISSKGRFHFRNVGPRKYSFSTTNDTHLLISDVYTSNLELRVPFQSHTIGVGFQQRRTVNLPLFYDVFVQRDKHGMMPRMVAASIIKQVNDTMTEAYSYRKLPYIFTTSEYEEKVSEIYYSDNSPPQPDSFHGISHIFPNDFVNNKPDEQLLNNFIEYFTGKDECQALPNSLKYSTKVFLINYGTRNPMEIKLNFTNAEMKRDPSVKYTGKHYSRSNNRVWDDPKNLQKQERISPTFIQWENRTTDPQLWDFMRFLRQHHVWNNRINAMSLHLEVAEYPVRYPFPYHIKPPAEYDYYKNLTTKHFVAEAMTAVIFNHSSKGEKRSFKTAVLSIKNYGEYCVDQFGTQPKLNNMDLHMDLLMKNLTKIIYTRVYSGNGCNLNIMNITETGRVTRKQRTSLRSAARALDGNDDQVEHFHRTAIYDDWNKTISVGDNRYDQIEGLAYSIENAWIKVQSLFWKSPLAAQKMLATNDRHYSIKFSRTAPLTWGIHAHSQYDDEQYQDHDEQYQEVVLDHEWLETSSLVTHESDYKFEKTCVISPNTVRTFDGLSVPVNSSCLSDFAILVNDWGSWRKKVAIMVLWRERSFEVKLIDIDSKAKMFFKSSELPDRLHVRDWDSSDGFSGYYLNSTESYWNKRKGRYGDVLECDIFQQDGKFKIDVKDVGHIYIHPREIRIALDENYRGHIGGLCGSWDHNPANDLAGPRGCPLHETEQFQLAWYLPHQAFDEQYPWYYHSRTTTESPIEANWYPGYYHYNRTTTVSPIKANSTSTPAPVACQRYVEQNKCFNL